MSEKLALWLFIIYVFIGIGAFGHAAHNTYDGIGIAPVAGMFWPFYVSYKLQEPEGE